MSVNVGWWADGAPLYLGAGHPFGKQARARERDLFVDLGHVQRHMHVIGGSGSGKSRCERLMLEQHIERNRGFTLIEPHGDLHNDTLAILAERALPGQPDERAARELGDKVVLIEPGRLELGSVGLNVLQTRPGQLPFTVVDGLVEVCRDIWGASFMSRSEDIVRNAASLAQEFDLTLLEVLAILTDSELRARLAARSRNADVRSYFEQLARLRPGEQVAMLEAPRNKLSAFVSSPYIKPLLGQSKSTIDFAQIMNEGKICLVNVSRDRLRESRKLLGALIVWLVQTAAISRENIPPEQRVSHFLIIDEFAEFYTSAIDNILTGSRKFGLSLSLIHQTLTGPPFDERPGAMDSILGNCHTLIAFNVSHRDAVRMANEMYSPSGTQIKHQDTFLGIPTARPQTWSMGDEGERCVAELKNQRVGEAFVCFRGQPDKHPLPYAARIPHVPDVVANKEKVAMLREHVARRYCRPQAVIEAEIRERWRRLQAEPARPVQTAPRDYTT